MRVPGGGIPRLDLSTVGRAAGKKASPKMQQQAKEIPKNVQANEGAKKRIPKLRRYKSAFALGDATLRNKAKQALQKTGQLFRSISFKNLKAALQTGNAPVHKPAQAPELAALTGQALTLPPESAKVEYGEALGRVEQLQGRAQGLQDLPKGLKNLRLTTQARIGKLGRLLKAKERALASVSTDKGVAAKQTRQIEKQFKQAVQELGFDPTRNLEKLAKTKGKLSLQLEGSKLKRRAKQELPRLQTQLKAAKSRANENFGQILRDGPSGVLKAFGFTAVDGKVSVPVGDESHTIDITPQKLWQTLMDGGKPPQRFDLGDSQLVIGGGKNGAMVLLVDPSFTSGAAGKISKATNLLTDKPVIVKAAISEPEALRADHQNLETITGGQPKDGVQKPHEALIEFHDDKGEVTEAILVTHLYTDGTLMELLTDEGAPKLTADQKLGFALDIFAGTAHIQDAGIIHLDIKPVNIFRQGDEVSVADFDACKSLTPALMDDPEFRDPTVNIDASADSIPSFEFYMINVLKNQIAERRAQFEDQFDTPEAQMEADGVLQALWDSFQSVVNQTHTWSAASAALDVLRQKITEAPRRDEQHVQYYSKQDEIKELREQLAGMSDPEAKALGRALDAIEKALEPFPFAPADPEMSHLKYKQDLRAKLSLAKDDYDPDAFGETMEALQSDYRPSTQECLSELQAAMALLS